jgi:hypothetical protein
MHEQEVQTIYGNPVTRKTRLDKVKNELIQQQKKMNIFLSRNVEIIITTTTTIKVHSLVYVWTKVMILQKLHKLLCVFVTLMWMKIYFVREFCALLIKQNVQKPKIFTLQ